MSRSVSIPSNAVGIVYIDRVFRVTESYDWDEFVDDLKTIIRERYPSFTDTPNRWISQEDQVILENGHGIITVSEYCGLVAICLVPLTDWWIGELAFSWCLQIEPYWTKYIESRYTTALRHVATASNGEAFFEKVAG